MKLFEKIEYTLKASVGGAGLGLAFSGVLTFFPFSITMATVTAVTLMSSALLSFYTFKNVG